MITRFKRLDFANIDCKASILVKGYSDADNINIGCFGYFLEKDGEKIIVDTGIDDIDTVNMTKSSKDDWKRSKTEGTMEENLKKIGVMAEEIDKVFITHSHYDHISGVCYFDNAHIYMSQKEYEYLCDDNNPHKRFLNDVIEFLENKKAKNLLTLIEDEYSENDVKCLVVGGHTVGSMLVYVGDYLFTGDNVFMLESIEKKLPIGFCNDPKGAYNALNICMKHNGKVLTGHDFGCCTDMEDIYV